MVIAGISGGMGNQMLIYAAGLALAKRLNTELFLDTSRFLKNGEFSDSMNRFNRTYCLDCFPNITEREFLFANYKKAPFWLRLNIFVHRKELQKHMIFRRFIWKLIRTFNLNYFSGYFNRPKLENLPDNIWLDDYLATEKEFENIAELIRYKFIFSPECFNKKLLAQVQNCNSVAFHIRRGDKVNTSFLPTTEDYIKASVEKIYELTNEPEFFVFSDDLDWCKKILPKIRNDASWHYIDNQTPPQDMALMTKCKHVIVAPSTFSWWGAWLNDNQKKIIIAPQSQDNETNPFPKEWIKV